MQAHVRYPVIDLYFDAEWTGRAILWLPEMLLVGHSDDERLRVSEQVVWDREPSTGCYGYDYRSADTGLSISAEVRAQGDRADLTLTVGNHSQQVWPDVVAGTCLQLGGSEFVDPHWSRTYFQSGGRLLPYSGQKCDGGQDVYRMSLVQGHRQLKRTARHRNKWGFTHEQSDDGVIAVTNSEGSRSLLTMWQDVHHLQANRTPAFACIHANPYFGTLEPGQSRTVCGWILVCDQPIAEAWQTAADVLRQAS